MHIYMHEVNVQVIVVVFETNNECRVQLLKSCIRNDIDASDNISSVYSKVYFIARTGPILNIPILK